MRFFTKSLALTASLALGLTASAADNLEGRWAATLKSASGVEIPFRLDITRQGDQVVGTLYNGRDPKTTSSASIHDGKVELNFEHYLTSIQADVKDGELDGRIISLRKATTAAGPQGNQQYAGTENRNNAPRNAPTPFHAKRYVAQAAKAAGEVPQIGGVWEVAQETPKGEKAWRLVVEQNGAEILATVLRIDGDAGGLTGEYQDGKFVASHYDGARPGLVVLTPQPDGSLNVKLNAVPRVVELTAFRPEIARAKGLPEPSNFLTHTTVRDPNEVFTYSFPDVNGKIISNEDPIVKNKVVIAVVTGTWCPNCHDEAQYLVQLQKKYADRGVQIIALDFEEEDQLKSLTRVKSFIAKYGVPYPYLIAGTPAEMWDKVPQAVNLNTWPATFFIGKDGKVKAVHSGFAAPASGPYHIALKEEFTSILEKLIKEQPAGENAPITTARAELR
ncbi:peroxiredoxin family protein [Paludibaculum fermentans]|uniref:TlpA family protein disulfide reductase n=1 Tax=Paludibaculum fermentans TaxID=1473598 RepID=A0A7S7SMT9_PALFE|nr:TlpA disulfide reductase family protein [Paludibaculum fermentans]QOY89395.1 TlpA family protein disulfide reductase [Paludibaculum fermentans]